MPELKPLQRFANGIPAYYDGDYVLYVDVKAREKILKDSLRNFVFGFPNQSTLAAMRVMGQALLAQFDAEDHQ